MVGIESTNILGVVVCLPNSLKTNFIKQNFAWWNIWISHFSLQNRELLKQWNSINYWNGEIIFVLITLWTIVSWQNYYIKALFWMDLYAFHHKPYLNIQQLVCFICISNCKFDKVMEYERLNISCRSALYKARPLIFKLCLILP